MLCAVCCILSVHAGVTATVQAFCYNRNAAEADELHRRFSACLKTRSCNG